MCEWDWILNPEPRRAHQRLMVRALVIGGLLLAAGVGIAFAQVPPQANTVGGVYNVTPPTFRDKTSATLQTDANGVLKVNTTLGAGSAIIGQVGIDQTTPGTTDSVTVKPQSYTSIGCPAAAPTCGTNQAGFTISTSSAHAALDVVGAAAGALTFANLCPAAGREVIITSTRLRYDASAVPAGMTSFRLWLYSVTPPSAYADDAPWQLLSGDRASSLGYIDLGSPVLPSPGSTSLVVETNGNQKQITCASTSVFGYLITNGAFTTAAETALVQLKSVAP